MTGTRAVLFHLDPDRVLVAVDAHRDHALTIAGGFALAPEALARAAVVPGLAAVDGAAQRLLIHVRDHEHLAGASVGRPGAHKPVGVERRGECEALFDLVGRGGRQVLTARPRAPS